MGITSASLPTKVTYLTSLEAPEKTHPDWLQRNLERLWKQQNGNRVTGKWRLLFGNTASDNCLMVAAGRDTAAKLIRQTAYV